MAALDSVVVGPGCDECSRLKDQVLRLTLVVQDQAKALADITDDCGPAAPSLACVYWLYGPTRWATRSWHKEWARLKPLISDIGDLPAAKLTPLAWSQHAARRKMQRDRRGNVPADHLLNLELARAKQLLGWAVANRMLKYNPLLPAKRTKAITRRETWLPLHDVERLLAACDDVVDKRRATGDDDGLRAKVLRAFILACHDSMLRFMEAMAIILRPERIGPEGRIELASAETKGAKRRAVFLTARTMEAIRDLPPKDPDNPVTPSRCSAGFGRPASWPASMPSWLRVRGASARTTCARAGPPPPMRTAPARRRCGTPLATRT
jgi:integrase